jgi:hypothetical protein
MNFFKKLFGASDEGFPDGYDFYLVKDNVQETTTVLPSGATLTETGGYRLIPQTYSAYSWCDHTLQGELSPNVMAEGVFVTAKQRSGLLKLLANEELSVFEVEP